VEVERSSGRDVRRRSGVRHDTTAGELRVSARGFPPQATLAPIAVVVAPALLERRYRTVVRALWRLRRTRRGKLIVAAGLAVFAIVVALLAVRHFAVTPWPLADGDPGWLAATGLLLLLAQVLKAFGWARLFAPEERPRSLALAAANGGAALVGLVLPGRFDEATRIAVVRRYGRCPAGLRTLALSLVMLGLIDSAALAPLAVAAAASRDAGIAVRAGLVVVAIAGAAAAALLVCLPRLAASRHALRFRLGRWLSSRTTSLRPAAEAWALVSACWLVRTFALFVLLGALGAGFSFALALVFLCAGAAAAALPIGPAGAVTQAGVGGAALIATGVHSSQAISAAVSIAALGVISGGAVLLFAVAWRTGQRLGSTRTERARRRGSA
jgi:hypothetical protein